MEFGKLNQRIAVLENYIVTDEIGNHISKWDEVYSCWANVTVKSSTETVNTGVTREVQSISFVVRQCEFLRGINSTTHKILFRGNAFDIQSVKPDYLRNDYVTITCDWRKAGAEHDID